MFIRASWQFLLSFISSGVMLLLSVQEISWESERVLLILYQQYLMDCVFHVPGCPYHHDTSTQAVTVLLELCV